MRLPIWSVCLLLVALLVFVSDVAAAECPDGDVDCLIGVLEKGDSKAALKAAMALGNLGETKAIDPLIHKLSAKDKYMATMAAYALAKIGEPAVPALLEATKDKRASVRKYATHALGQIGGDVYEVLSRLSRDEDPAVRYRAILAMQIQKDERSLSDAVLAMKDRYKKVKLEAVRLMGLLQDPRCIDSLVLHGMTDLSQEVSMESAAVLIRFGDPAVEPLIENFEPRPAFVKTRMIYVLGEIARKNTGEKGEKAKEFLIHVVDTPQKDVVVKQAAIVKLGDVGDEKAIPALQKLLKKIQGKPEYEELVQVTVRTLEKLQKK